MNENEEFEFALALEQENKAKQSSSPVGLQGFVQQHISPISFPVISGLEKMGGQVKDAAQQSFKNIVDKPSTGFLPPGMRVPAEVGRQMVSQIGQGAIQAAPFKPSEFSTYAGAELLPTALIPSRIAPNYGRAMMESAIPSGAKEIKASERMATITGKESSTAAQKVIKAPELGSTRADILKNSQKQIQDIEGEIRAGLNAYKDIQVPKSKLVSVYDDLIEKYKKIPNSGRDVRHLERLKKEFVSDYPESQSVPEWNQAKRGLHEKTGDAGYISQKPSVQVQADKALARKIRDLVGEKVPGIKKLSRKQGDLLEIRDAIIESSPKEVRDFSPLSPLKERLTIGGSRFLSKKRLVPPGIGVSAVPFLTEDSNPQ